jgi:hypothetical protein
LWLNKTPLYINTTFSYSFLHLYGIWVRYFGYWEQWFLKHQGASVLHLLSFHVYGSQVWSFDRSAEFLHISFMTLQSFLEVVFCFSINIYFVSESRNSVF